MEKKAVDFKIKTRSLAAAAPLGDEHSPMTFEAEIRALLDTGWDVLSSQSIGLDTGGGVGGAGNIMVYVTLVKYGYFEVINKDAAVEAPSA